MFSAVSRRSSWQGLQLMGQQPIRYSQSGNILERPSQLSLIYIKIGPILRGFVLALLRKQPSTTLLRAAKLSERLGETRSSGASGYSRGFRPFNTYPSQHQASANTSLTTLKLPPPRQLVMITSGNAQTYPQSPPQPAQDEYIEPTQIEFHNVSSPRICMRTALMYDGAVEHLLAELAHDNNVFTMVIEKFGPVSRYTVRTDYVAGDHV